MPVAHGSVLLSPSQACACRLACSTSWPGMAVTTIAIGIDSISCCWALAARAVATSSCSALRCRSSCSSMPLNATTSRPISSPLSQEARSV